MRKKIIFLYDMEFDTLWKDGLWAALNLLKQDFEVVEINMYGKPTGVTAAELVLMENASLLLAWGSFNSKPFEYVVRVKMVNGDAIKTGLCVGGLIPDANYLEYLDVVFYETLQGKEQVSKHSNIYHAFGVNTEIFYPKDSPKVWDYIGVGSFANWKRWEYMLKKRGKRLVVGHYQQESSESTKIVHLLMLGGIMVSSEVAPEILADFYRFSKTVYIPSTRLGGGERAVLEARACGLPVEVESDNLKLQSLLESPIYDQTYYYQQLKKGIESIL